MRIWTKISHIWRTTSPKALDHSEAPMYTESMLKGQQQDYSKRRNSQMKFISEKTKTFKLFNALINGQAVTPARAMHDFGIKNIAAEASRIRQAGYAVYANPRKAGNGVMVTEYVIGKPSRKVIAAGYRALAMGL